MSDKEDQNLPPKSNKNTTPSVDNLKPPKLTAIAGGRSNTAKKEQPEVKGSNKPVHMAIVNSMMGENPLWPVFPAKLHKVVDRAGNSVIYEEDAAGIVNMVSLAQVEAHVANYWMNVLPESKTRPVMLGDMTADDAVKVRRLWVTLAPPVKKPFKLLAWKSDPEPAHQKVGFDPMQMGVDIDAMAPCFSELMGRTSNAMGLMAWIGSLFDHQSQRQQYVWLYGMGGNGKGAMIRVLDRVLGPVAASEQIPKGENRFWTSGLLDKRLIVFPDCNNASFVTSGLFKSLTGEDSIRIERKGEAVYKVNLFGKFLFSSNDRPRITAQASDLRRVLFCKVGPVPPDAIKKDYEAHLEAETPAFISYCWEAYQAMTNGDPRCLYDVENTEEIGELAQATEHEYSTFVDKFLDVRDYEDSTPLNKRSYINTGDMHGFMLQFGFHTEYERRKCRLYLEQIGVICKLIKINDNVKRVFLNCTKSTEI